ncbi:hypothetical protein QZH56_30355 [Streptomyces olivoreticuli]|uniref:hypothetical protein n=1 Tax=Streptomyces olivoreticuli TaxID=68246 RepID=UPI002658E846|nr:hypothetical protein [Streptomyces olivoreticuli]WKK23007.1 hypothetical protein QZH56_30355 [Streptomyces olivoreticuli]
MLIIDALARLLIATADAVTVRSRVPNPMHLTRVVLEELADNGGGDFYEAVQRRAHGAGFSWLIRD